MTREPTNAPPALLRPHHVVAERVVCPGDPGRALRLAQELTEGVPPMLNHHRGLWGYGGDALDGRPLTVQATGVGGPSAALVVADLVALGARRLVRVGTATATDPALPLGALIVAERVEGEDGTSRALGPAAPDDALTRALAAGADARATIVSADLWPCAAAHDRAAAAGDGGADAPATGVAGAPDAAAAGAPRPAAVVRDLQSAAFVAAAAHGGAAAAVLVIVARDAAGARLDDAALLAAEARAGRLALAALA